jgi:hypothetical protein
MLEDREGGAYCHLCYWLAPLLQDFLPDMMNLAPVHHGAPPPFFQHALDLLQDGFNFFEVVPQELGMVTANQLYKNFTSDLPDSKVTDRFPAVNFPAVVWPRLALTVLEAAPRQLVFDLVHGLVRNRARLYQQRRVDDPWCQVCPMVDGQRVAHDPAHIFTGYCLVKEAWPYVKALVRRHQSSVWPEPQPLPMTEEEMVSFTFSVQKKDGEIVWILANYFKLVWKESEERGKKLTAAGVRGFLRSKLNIIKHRKVGTILVTL